jgi:hypothetical protein
MEDKARGELEADGCQPCYPPEVSFPYQNVPKDVEEMIDYWLGFGTRGGRVTRPVEKLGFE